MLNIRSFIAIPIPAAMQKSAAGMVTRLSGPGDGIKWVPGDNLHLTLKFLGDVDNRDIPKLCDVVKQCCAGHDAFPLEFRGAGAFPSPEKPRVVYAKVTVGGEPLTALVEALQPALAELGFKPEPRDYVPHMTLGRTRGGSRRGSSELQERIAAQSESRLGQMLADRVLVMGSFLDKAGPSYHVMGTIPLNGE